MTTDQWASESIAAAEWLLAGMIIITVVFWLLMKKKNPRRNEGRKPL